MIAGGTFGLVYTCWALTVWLAALTAAIRLDMP